MRRSRSLHGVDTLAVVLSRKATETAGIATAATDALMRPRRVPHEAAIRAVARSLKGQEKDSVAVSMAILMMAVAHNRLCKVNPSGTCPAGVGSLS